MVVDTTLTLELKLQLPIQWIFVVKEREVEGSITIISLTSGSKMATVGFSR